MENNYQPPLKDSLTISIKRWEKESEFLEDIRSLAKKYGVDYDISDYFKEKSSLLSFDETYDLLDLTNVKTKYIKQIHQANILANILYLLFDEIETKHRFNILDSLFLFDSGDDIIFLE